MTLALLLTAVGGAWAADTYTITFSGFGNEACNKTVTDATLEYSETFNMADVDANYTNFYDVGGSNEYVSISQDNTQFTITVKSAFEGTVNVTVYYLNGDGDEDDRRISVTCVKNAPTEPTIEVTTNAASEQDFFTEATFTMPTYDVTVNYELVRDMQDEANPVAFSGLPSSGNIVVKKGSGGKYQPAEALTIQLIDPLAAEDAKNIIAADGITVKVLVGDGGTPIEYDQENPITLEAFLADMKPGYYWIKAEATDENSPYDGTVYSSEFTVVEQYDLTVKPANDFSKKGLDAVTVGTESLTIDANTGEATKTGIAPDTKVKVKAKRGQKTSRRFLSLVLTDEIEEDKLRAFFAGAGRLRLMPDEEFDRLNGHVLTSGEVLLKKRLKKAVVGITVASVLCIIGVLLPLRGLRNGFIILGALLPLALFGLVMVFQRYLLVCRGEDSRWNETKCERTIDTEPALVITASAQFILLWACEVRYFPMAEGSFGRWAGFAAVPSAIVAGAMLLVMLSQTSGWKDRLYSALLCLCFALFSCFDAVYLLNGALDATPPAVHSARVEEKWSDRGYKGQDYYYVRVVRGNGSKEEFDILEPEYERIEKGDSITIEEYAGAFGIPYKKAVVPDEKVN